MEARRRAPRLRRVDVDPSSARTARDLFLGPRAQRTVHEPQGRTACRIEETPAWPPPILHSLSYAAPRASPKPTSPWQPRLEAHESTGRNEGTDELLGRREKTSRPRLRRAEPQ